MKKVKGVQRNLNFNLGFFPDFSKFFNQIFFVIYHVLIAVSLSSIRNSSCRVTIVCCKFERCWDSSNAGLNIRGELQNCVSRAGFVVSQTSMWHLANQGITIKKNKETTFKINPSLDSQLISKLNLISLNFLPVGYFNSYTNILK